jgi:hypothetical protein
MINVHHEASPSNFSPDSAKTGQYLHYEAKTPDYRPVFETSREMQFKINMSGGSAFDYTVNKTDKMPTVLTCTIMEN